MHARAQDCYRNAHRHRDRDIRIHFASRLHFIFTVHALCMYVVFVVWWSGFLRFVFVPPVWKCKSAKYLPDSVQSMVGRSAVTRPGRNIFRTHDAAAAAALLFSLPFTVCLQVSFSAPADCAHRVEHSYYFCFVRFFFFFANEIFMYIPTYIQSGQTFPVLPNWFGGRCIDRRDKRITLTAWHRVGIRYYSYYCPAHAHSLPGPVFRPRPDTDRCFLHVFDFGTLSDWLVLESTESVFFRCWSTV